MNSLMPMIKKEILEIYRSKKFLILIILLLFMAISSPILAKLMPMLLKFVPETPGLTINIPDPTWRDAVDQLVKNLSQLGLIVLIIIFAGSIAEEKNKKTLELVLTKPVSRSNFITAKFVSALFATKIVYIAAMVIFYFYTTSLFGAFSLLNFVYLSFFSLIFFAFVVALTLFFSTIAKSMIVALVLAFSAETVITIIFSSIKKIANYSPSYIFGHYTDLMANGQINAFLPSAILSIAAMVILLFLSIHFFKRQEVER